MTITNVLGRFRRMAPKQVITAGVFAIALAGAVGLGLAVKQNTSAASVRDTGTNPIINKGSIGCLTKDECISDIRANREGDLPAIYAGYASGFGMTSADYDNFLKNAKMGTTYKDGRVVVDGKVVMENAWSMGRETWGNQREPHYINGKKYYKSRTHDSFVANSIETLVLFNADGTVKIAMLTACGNPVWGTKKTPKYSCDMLTKTEHKTKKDTYIFKATGTATNNASIVRYEFDFGDGVKKSSTSDSIEHTYTKPGKYTATVKVIVKVPGTAEKEVTGAKCKTEVEIIAPYYACIKLMAQTSDPKKQKFTFTAVTDYNEKVKLIDADFTYDGKVTVEGVKPNADKKTFTTERTFTDSAKHEIVAKINFDVAGKVTSVSCKTSIESEKTPVCIVNGKPYPNEQNPYAPNDERCKETPVTPAPELPKTGAGSVVGLFAGTSIIGAAAHRVIMSRRARRSNEQTEIDQINSL